MVQEPQHVHRPQRLPRLIPLRAVHGLDHQGTRVPHHAQQERLKGKDKDIRITGKDVFAREDVKS